MSNSVLTTAAFPQKTNDDLQEIIQRNQSGSQVNDELQKSPFDTVYFRYLTEFSELRAMRASGVNKFHELFINNDNS